MLTKVRVPIAAHSSLALPCLPEAPLLFYARTPYHNDADGTSTLIGIQTLRQIPAIGDELSEDKGRTREEQGKD